MGDTEKQIVKEFKTIERLYGELVNAIDSLSHKVHNPYKVDIDESINVSYMDFRKWKRGR